MEIDTMPGDIHVVPYDSEWAIAIEGSREFSLYESREVAITVATMVAKEQRVDLMIHRYDGQIVERYPSGPDTESRWE
jgi:hypothetical protein